MQNESIFRVFNSRRYHQLLTLVPSDPGVLSKLGELYDSENEKSQAFHYFYEVTPEISFVLSVVSTRCGFIVIGSFETTIINLCLTVFREGSLPNYCYCLKG